MRGWAVGLVVLFCVGCSAGDRAATIADDTDSADKTKDNAEPLGSALLTIDDLPTGWTTPSSVSPSPETDENKEATEFCNQELVDDRTVREKAEAEFQKGELSRRLFQTVRSFDNSKVAKDSMNELRTRLQRCTHWDDRDSDGTTTKWDLRPLSFAKFGDETLALRLTADIQSGDETFSLSATGEGDVVIVRRRNIMMLIGHFAIGFMGPARLDSNETETIVKAADAKLAGFD